MKIKTAEFVQAAHGSDGLLRDDRPQVAFVGRSNVGKSSLLNRLLGRKSLARTSSTPGRTRSVNYFLINRRFYFVDLPGYGYAKAGKWERQEWAKLVEAYLQGATSPEPRLVGIVQLVDAKVGATELDAEAFEYLASFGLEVEVVATKADRLPRGRWQQALAGIRRRLGMARDGRPIAVSARTGEGIKELWGVIDDRLDRLG